MQVATEAFIFLEQFSLEVMPTLWPRESTRLQAQIFNLVFTGQMGGRHYTVIDLTRILNEPRSTINSALEKLVDLRKLGTRVDEDDGRRRLLSIPTNMAQEVEAMEIILVKMLCFWQQRLDDILKMEGEASAAAKKLEVLEDAFRKLREIE